MFKNRSLSLIFALLIIFALSVGSAAAQGNGPSATAVGTAFTYQGQLKDGSGNPVTATCAFNFSLWDSLSNNTGQIGSTLNKTGVAVSNGLFTVTLDFGSSAFTGSARWLEIAVKCGSDGGFTTLTPRQPLTPAPFAMYSLNTAKLNGLPASAYQQNYKNMLVVAKSGSPYTTITSALDTIGDASATNPYLIYVAPGVYNEQVTMKSYVDIQGAGEDATKITYTNTNSCINCGTVNGADNAELRYLTVESTGGSNVAIAIDASCYGSVRITHVTALASGGALWTRGLQIDCGAAPTLTDVTASASGGSNENYGVNDYSSSPKMTNVTASASGGTNNYAVRNDSSSPTMTNVSVSASGGTNAYGVYNTGSSPKMMGVNAFASDGTNNYGVYNDASSPTMTDVAINVSGGTYTYGVYNDNSSSPIMTNVNASATGGTNGYGMWNKNSSPTVRNSSLYGEGSYTGDGVHNNSTVSGTYVLLVNNSYLSGGSSTIYSDSADYTIRVGASQLVGNGGQGSGHYTCVDSYKGDYSVLDSSCH